MAESQQKAKKNVRKRPQARRGTTSRRAAKAKAARGDDRRRNLTVGIVIAVVLVAAAGGVIYYNTQSSSGLGAVPVTRVQADYPVQRDGGVVVAGQPDAPAVVDAYLDFLCPACGAFEEAYAEDITAALNAGDLRMRYHMLPMLNPLSDPPGYSQEAANAALCAADGGQFPSYFASLFAGQPEEGGPGYTTGQLVTLGSELGLGERFAPCVQGGTHDNAVAAQMEAARNTPFTGVDEDGFPGTPTIAVDNEVQDYRDPEWLSKVIAEAKRG